jgi:hypothetical protein
MNRMKLSMAILGVLVLVTALLTGCEIFSPDRGDSSQPVETSQFGGYTTTDEAPAFADAELLTGYPEDQPYDDDMENDPAVNRAMNERGARQYALRIIWGDVERRDSSSTDAGDCPVSDWSGTIEVDGGVVVIERLIQFEPGDYVIRPRRGPRTIGWVSYTKNHVDGLLLKIIDVPEPGDRETRNTLTITTPFYAGEILLADLDDYREFVTYHECNAISIVATRIEPLGCPRGFMEGRWVAETDTSGYFKGVWIGNLGTIMGYLRGSYGVCEGERVLFGKWISTTGEFRGLLRGTWAPLYAERGPNGVFEGRWVDENLDLGGFFRGYFAVCSGDTAGAFHGRWVEVCK